MKKRDDNVNPECVEQDFEHIMRVYSPSLESPSTEWKKIGDFFEQFSLYDISEMSFTSNKIVMGKLPDLVIL